MLSSTSDYALRATLALARHQSGRPLRADEIAQATGAPPNSMAKTLNALVKAGIVTSARGPLGGFALACPPDALTIARVVDCFEEARPQRRCLPGNGPCDSRRPCTAHNRWAEIKDARRALFADTTVADLIAG